jgi:hypothetical protein
MKVLVKAEPGALVFPGARGGPLRRGNFNKLSAWPQGVESIDMTGLHFPRPSPYREPVRGRELRQDPGPDGPHGPRQRASSNDPPEKHEARGTDQLITSAVDAHV